MGLADAMIAELNQEADGTRKVLERVPEDKLSWRPHSKSMSLGQLALHVAQTPGGVAQLLSQTPAPPPDFSTREEATSRSQLLNELESSVDTASAKLAEWGDEGLGSQWEMKAGDRTLMQLPRGGMARAIMFNHLYHHRGQLTVYLRLLDVPLPVIYGDSADEEPAFG